MSDANAEILLRKLRDCLCSDQAKTEVEIDNASRCKLETRFSALGHHPDPWRLLEDDYREACVQMRHWDMLVLTMAIAVLGGGAASIWGLSGWKTDLHVLRSTSHGVVAVTLWLWVWFVYDKFRKRAMRSLQLVKLLECILERSAQRYPLQDEGLGGATRGYSTAFKLPWFVKMIVLALSLFSVASALYPPLPGSTQEKTNRAAVTASPSLDSTAK